MIESVVDEPFACPNCGKSSDKHPTMDVSNAKTIFLCQDRAAKWQRVEPGTVIPAGQPYRVEYEEPINDGSTLRDTLARERIKPYDQTVPPVAVQPEGPARDWYVDSSWKPALVLPTEPTWGIAVYKNSGCHVAQVTGLWSVVCGQWIETTGNTFRIPMSAVVLDFIPLTDEQVQRIEAAR